MSIPLGDSDDVPPEWQYEERFWRRRLDGIALDTVKKRCYPRCRCVRVKGRKEARADNCLGGVKEGASEFI